VLIDYVAKFRRKTYRRWNTRRLKYLVLGEKTDGSVFVAGWCSVLSGIRHQYWRCCHLGCAHVHIVPVRPVQSRAAKQGEDHAQAPA
jgi:hypothetical protein